MNLFSRISRIDTLVCCSVASSAAVSASVCTQGDLSRTVSVVYSQPGQPVPCEVLYEKSMEGESLTLWRAQNEVGYCEARAAEFIEKLGSLGWSCREDSGAKTTGGDEPASTNG